MTKRIYYILLAGVLVATTMACGQSKPKGSRTDTTTSGAISFASDESFSPIVEECRAVFENEPVRRGKASITPIYMSEGEALDLLVYDTMQLVIASRKLRPQEEDTLLKRQFRARQIPVAYDGLALIVHRNNPDTCITVDDVKRILSGDAQEWTDIYPSSRLGKIRLAFDQSRSAAAQFCVDSILGGRPLGSNATATHSTQELISYVERTPNAIGICGSNLLFDQRDTTHITWNKNLSVMRVTIEKEAKPYNSWKPYQAYLLDGRYPFVRTIYAILNDPYNGLPYAFARFMENQKGQLIFMKAGLLPMRADITIRDVRFQ